MITFSVNGNIDPLLKCHLEQGDVLYCESSAMVAMDERLSLVGKTRGGFFNAFGRKFLNAESFFQQEIQAKLGEGDVLLSPELAGDVKILEVGQREYVICDGCYLANTPGVHIGTKTQGIGKMLFAKTGSGIRGFFIMHATGEGQLAVSGYGMSHFIDVTPDHPVFVNNGHLVAWDSSLKYEVAVNIGHKGFLGKVVESFISGSGIVLKFSGTGRIVVCSRNRQTFLDWVQTNIDPSKLAK